MCLYYNAIAIATANPSVAPDDGVAHSGAVAPVLTVNTWPADPSPNFAGTFAAEAYTTSP